MPETNLNTNEPSPTTQLPEDGTRVTATTLPSIEYDRGEEEIEGELYKIVSPLDGTPNCYVNRIGVDPSTVKPVEARRGLEASNVGESPSDQNGV